MGGGLVCFGVRLPVETTRVTLKMATHDVTITSEGHCEDWALDN